MSTGTPGTLAPGVGGIGTLTINNSLTLGGNATMEINRTTGSDKVAGITTVTYGGTLTVQNIGPALQFGDSFTLFSASAYAGSFASMILPTLTAGLVWDTSNLSVNKSKITIAGQTAPGPGITMRDYTFGVAGSQAAPVSDVVVRYIRSRKGDLQTSEDAAGVLGGAGSTSFVATSNVVIDHVSASWGEDEVLSLTNHSTGITVQYSYITEGLDAAGCLICSGPTLAIWIRASDRWERQRFTICHECGHTFFPGFALQPRYRCSPAARTFSPVTGIALKRRLRRCTTAGFIPATRAA